MPSKTLQTTRWLAERLGLSLTTIERLRTNGSPDLPPAIVIGGSIRYDEATVEHWLLDRQKAPTGPAPREGEGGQHVAS